MASNYDGFVKREDLYFRSSYPEIATKIFKISETEFEIFFENVPNFDEINQHFEKTKFITTPVKLTQTIPNNYLEVISNIQDQEIAKGFSGISMTHYDFLEILVDKFPNAYFYKIKEERDSIIIYTASFNETINGQKYIRFLNNRDRQKIETFLDGLNWPLKLILEEEQLSDNPQNLVIKDKHTKKIVPGTSRILSDYTQRDDAIWYDNTDGIFDGSFKKENLYFFNPLEYSCYVDYTVFNNINIRNHLFLFQTIYLTPPHRRSSTVQDWLKLNNISRSEFLDLVNNNRIKLILFQDESDYDRDFILEVYNTNPRAVITKRAVSALQMIDIVETANNYILNDVAVLKEIRKLCSIAAKIGNTKAEFVYDSLIWPIKARRIAFERLHRSGLSKIASFGINTAIENEISHRIQKDLTFEFTVSTSQIHIAHSLGATYFPYIAEDGFSDMPYTSIMGDFLNFYKNASKANLKSYLSDKAKVDSGVLQINPIDVINVNNLVSIEELEDLISEDVIYSKNKKLIETLANLSENEREQKINLYNEKVQRKINRTKKNKTVIDLGSNLIMDGIGMLTGFGLLGFTTSLLKGATNSIPKGVLPMDSLQNKIDEALYNIDESNIHYLSKINRVARIKRKL